MWSLSISMEKWILKNPKVDFNKMSKALGISELLCRILVNRGIVDLEDAQNFIRPEITRLHDGTRMKDLQKGVGILKEKILQGRKVRVIGDYDVDGVVSTYILYRALSICGAVVDYAIPHRILDGYGINHNIVETAEQDGIDTIITCDNGISAIDQIKYAKEIGLTVVITDHHDVPFVEDNAANRISVIPEADAVIDIKQSDCGYPFKLLCGAGVAFKFVQVLFKEMGIPTAAEEEFYEFVAIATVCDVVDLTGENRIFVKKGISHLNYTSNIGLRALIEQIGLSGKNISVYHIGFIIGPCINASGRLDWAMKGLELLLCSDRDEAERLAQELYELNNERKSITVKGLEETIETIEKNNMQRDKVLVVYKPDVHESIAGIIAGRVREKYNIPTIILTDAENGVKGSGRSIDQYNMFEELLKCKSLLTKFGGHPMAAGLSLEEGNIEILRQRLNSQTTLTEDDLVPKIYIDARMPVGEINIRIAEEICSLEPFGKGNSKPLFAEKQVSVCRGTILGNEKKILKLRLLSVDKKYIDCIYFGDIDALNAYISAKFGTEALQKMYKGQKSNTLLDIAFYIDINEYNGARSVQLILQNYR